MNAPPDNPSCTLDDSTRTVNGRMVYAHHLQHPNYETNTLVFITHHHEIVLMKKHFEDILSSYVTAARDGLPLLACEHYSAYPKLKREISHFVNHQTIQNHPENHQAQFYNTDAIVGQVSRKAEQLLQKNDIKQGWEERDGILIYNPAQIPLQRRPKHHRESSSKTPTYEDILKHMKRNYRAAFYQ